MEMVPNAHLAKIIISNTVLFSVLVFLLKLWIEKRLSHSLHEQLERFKSSLAKDLAKRSIQESHNFSKKMEVCSELNTLMLEADAELKLMYMNLGVKNYSEVAKNNDNFAGKYLKINALLHENELYLDDELVLLVKKVYEPFFNLVMEVMETGNKDAYEKLNLNGNFKDLELGVANPRKVVVSKIKELYGINS